MDRGDWKSRLQAEIEAAIRRDPSLSLSSISKAAGFGPNYLGQMFNNEKTPRVENLMRVCDKIGSSVAYILTGIKIGKAEEELIRLWQSLPDDQTKEHFLGLARSLAGKPPDEAPS